MSVREPSEVNTAGIMTRKGNDDDHVDTTEKKHSHEKLKEIQGVNTNTVNASDNSAASAVNQAQDFASITPKKTTDFRDHIGEQGVTFPERLMELVMNEADNQALWWMPGGKSFAIHSKRFTKTILAKNFQGSKFESFTRKLARWGFKRINMPDTPTNTFVFEHPFFLQSRPHLAKEISGSKKRHSMTLELDKSHIPTLTKPPQTTTTAAPAPNTTNATIVSAPAPWPTFAEPQELSFEGRLHSNAPNRVDSRDSRNASAGTNRINQLQPDLERQLIRNHFINKSIETAPAANVTAQFHTQAENRVAVQAQTVSGNLYMFAQQQQGLSPLGLSLAETNHRSGSPNLLPRIASAPFSNLDSIQRGSRFPSTTQTARFPVPSLSASVVPTATPDLSVIYASRTTIPPVGVSNSIPTAAGTRAAAAAGTIDPVIRLYLQQEEARRQGALLLQQQLLRHEIRLLEQQQQRIRHGKNDK